ncbi:hypothetical protein [Methanolobus halotolerans]|uniref:Uncharacterized protein n=1 Tax=Methanolobus halotolerans TaxID=2052935 RepID=A0A4E0R2C7_9EURY|nr:hypothetical protein [Methanolobus halotolerans]TGC11543.1 hypothetical protein CUN85_01355 [Methanolobus halotolerans]
MIREIGMIIQLSLLELLAFAGPVLLIGLLLGYMERLSNNYLRQSFGKKAILLTAWIGVPVHETGHLLMCWMFRHRIRKVKLLDLKASDATLGYVQHSYSRTSLYQSMGNFFIGIGPILSGNVVLIGSMYILLPELFSSFSGQLAVFTGSTLSGSSFMASVATFLTGLLASLADPANLVNINFWIYILLSIGVSSHIALSRADLKGATRGLPVIFIVLIVANTLAFVIYADPRNVAGEILRYNIYLLGFSILSIIFSGLNLLLSYFAWSLRKRM